MEKADATRVKSSFENQLTNHPNLSKDWGVDKYHVFCKATQRHGQAMYIIVNSKAYSRNSAMYGNAFK